MEPPEQDHPDDTGGADSQFYPRTDRSRESPVEKPMNPHLVRIAGTDCLRELHEELSARPDEIHVPILSCKLCRIGLSIRWARHRKAFSIYHPVSSNCKASELFVHLSAKDHQSAIKEWNDIHQQK